MIPDRYATSAKYYDEVYTQMNRSDVPFYVELANKSHGPVFEIGCGTGRILLPIARSGIEIHGLDDSAAMLQVLGEHLAEEPAMVKRNIILHSGDMRRFRGQQKYPLVTIPFGPMIYMYTLDDQLAALQTAAFHLQTDGTLAFDVLFANFQFEHLQSSIGKEILEIEYSDAARPGRIVRRYSRLDSYDKIGLSCTLTLIYRAYEGDILLDEEAVPLKMIGYTYHHLKALFLLAHLRTVEEYGSFTKAPLDNDSTNMIFLLKKA